MHFLIGRMGRDCLLPGGEQETLQQMIANWEQRNAKYYAASIKYMGKRLDAAQASGGPSARDAVARAFGNAVRKGGEDSASDWFKQGSKEDVCNRFVQLTDAGGMDVSDKVPMFGELEALAAWANAN